MSINLYQSGVSALLAAQQQLATTGHNIANVNTDGYSRQRAEQSVLTGNAHGGNFIGSGTYIQDVTRIYNQFSYKEQLSNTSNLGNANTRFAQLNQLNDIMSYSGSSVMTSIEQFYQAMNGIADNPSDTGLRGIALSQATVLSADFNSLNSNFDQLEKSVNGEMNEIAKRMSDISLEIASLNETIQFKQDKLTGQPNDLLDKRDQLVTELGQYTKVNTVIDDHGVMSVMVGDGNTLVAGITPLSVQLQAGDPDPLKTELFLVGNNSSAALHGETVGGELGAMFEFRDEHLVQARNEINRLSLAISSTLNDAQAKGLDLNEQQGENIFTDINSLLLQQGRVLPHSDNTGNLDARVEITDVSDLPTDEFQIRFDGANYTMTNLTTNTSSVLVEAPPGTFDTGLGFNFMVDGGAAAIDDTFNIRPVENSAALMEVTLKSGNGIAASSAVAVTPSDKNVSAGDIKVVNTLDPEQARLVMPVRIDIMEVAPGDFDYTYTDNNGVTTGPFDYLTPPLEVVDLPPPPATPLFQVEISGEPSGLPPSAPEQFFIGDAYGIGNSTNATAMALTQEKGILNGGKETFSQNLSITTADVGSKTSSADLLAKTSEALFTQAYNRNQETSGVNLDEEAANLIKFQQAYQAASQIISTASTIFDTLLSVAR